MSTTAFYGLAAALAVAAGALALVPLLRGRSAGADAQRSRAQAHRRRLAELDAERRAGLLSPEDHTEARREVEEALARELAAADGVRASGRTRLAAGAVVVAALAGGVALYGWLGRPELGDPQLVARMPTPEAGPVSVEAMVARLEARLRERPEDARGWMMLGRSYRVLGRAAEAARAYGEALKRIDGPSADLLVAYAEARILAGEGEVDAEAAQALTRALAQDPDHALGLWLDGLGAFQRGDYARAVARWERVLATGGAADPKVESMLREQIAEARRRLGAPGAASASSGEREAEQEQ